MILRGEFYRHNHIKRVLCFEKIDNGIISDYAVENTIINENIFVVRLRAHTFKLLI